MYFCNINWVHVHYNFQVWLQLQHVLKYSLHTPFRWNKQSSPSLLGAFPFPPGFVPEVKSHGNWKKGTPFHPTRASTKHRIKEECGTWGPKDVVAALSSAEGGILEAVAPGQLPCGEKQIVNFKAKMSVASKLSSFPGISRNAAADDLFLVMHKTFTEDPTRKFVRAVNAAPEPAVVVTTDRQLADLLIFALRNSNLRHLLSIQHFAWVNSMSPHYLPAPPPRIQTVWKSTGFYRPVLHTL